MMALIVWVILHLWAMLQILSIAKSSLSINHEGVFIFIGFLFIIVTFISGLVLLFAPLTNGKDVNTDSD